MKAIKENKSYSVNTDAEAKIYKAKGYDIYDDKGKLKEKGIGSAVPPEKYEALEKENAKLKKEIEKLKADTPKE
jgi:hypothetical protein